MQRDNINSEVLRLAVPSILANITIPLVGIVDVAIAGHIADAAAIGGIAVGTMLFDLLYWNFGFLRVGTSGMTAQAYGRGDREDCARLLSQSVSTALAAAAVIWLLQWFFVTAVLALMPCSAEVAEFARKYFFIRIWAAPATLCLMSLKGWFIGMQDTVAPMAMDIVVNVVNMAASYLLAVYTPLGALGVAWGTLIAQYAGLLTAGIVMRYKRSEMGYRELAKTAFSPDFIGKNVRWNSMRPLFVLNGNLFVRSLCFMVVYVGYTVIASGFGDTELAVSAIMMKLFMFFSFFADGFAYAGEALTGKMGVKDEVEVEVEVEDEIEDEDKRWRRTKDVDRIVRVLFAWGVGIGLLFSTMYAVLREPLIALMTNDADIQTAAAAYYVWLMLMPFISSLAFVWDGIYIGATAAIPIRNCMIWSAAAFLATYFLLTALNGWGYGVPATQALYASYFAHLLVRTLYLTLVWRRTTADEGQCEGSHGAENVQN